MLKRCTGEEERDLYPLTWRFLKGRLRHAMVPREKAIMEELIGEVRPLSDGEILVRRGEVAGSSSMLIEGFMLRAIDLSGRRSAVSLHVPGDFVDLHAYALKRLDHDVVASGECKIGLVDHLRLDEVLQTEPHLTRLLWFSTLLDAAIHREWIGKLEQLQAAQRVAHIFAEIWYRLNMVDLGSEKVIRTPLTQAVLAQMCGITSIHMNRALGQLRREGIADFRRGTLYTEDRTRLEAFGAFDPSYLYGDEGLGVQDELSR